MSADADNFQRIENLKCWFCEFGDAVIVTSIFGPGSTDIDSVKTGRAITNPNPRSSQEALPGRTSYFSLLLEEPFTG